MSIFADREIVTSAATISAMAMFLGGLSQFAHRGEPEYYIGYAIACGGIALLAITLLAKRDRRMLAVVRFLLGAVLVSLLAGVLIGFPPIH